MASRRPDRSQQDLFDATARPVMPQDLEIVPRGAVPLGKEQVRFNRLLAQVGALRAKLAEWAASDQERHRQVVEELLPLEQRLSVARRALILSVAAILEGRAGGGVARPAERDGLTDFLLELLDAQLRDAPDDEQLVGLYDEYSDLRFAEVVDFGQELARDFAAQAFDVPFDDEDPGDSREDLLAADMARQRRADETRSGAAGAHGGAKARERAERKAAAAEQAAREVSQSVREVYRKLASALHPDRASDEADRARRHEAMQRVNTAYEAHDLLALLTLQLEIEQIDAEHLARVSQERLRHYNAVLREQQKELEQELETIRDGFRMLLDDPHTPVTPAAVQAALHRDVGSARRAIREIEAHHEMLLHAVPRRRWLKEYARERRAGKREEARLMESLVDEFVVGFDGEPDGGFEQRIAEFYAQGLDPFGDHAAALFGDFDPFGGPKPAGAARRRSRKKRPGKRRR